MQKTTQIFCVLFCMAFLFGKGVHSIMIYDAIVIGGGAVGCATARELSRYDLRLALCEKGEDVCVGTSKANSAIVHAGYDPHPGTNMARLNVEGNRLMPELCRRLDVPFRQTGSHVLAFCEAELETLKALYARGVENGVPGMKLLTGDEARAMEPNLSEAVCGSLWAPSAGVISPWELTLALIETAVRNGTELHLEAPVTALRQENGHFTAETPKGVFEAKYVMNAAGVHCEEIAAMLGCADYTIQPNRGEYFLLDKSEGTRVRSTIFQCPNENGKGVLVSPTVHGNLIVGPNAVNISDPDGTENTAAGLAFVREMALKSVPSISFRDNIRNFSGVRANHPEDDFLIGENPKVSGFYELAGVKSPGLSSAPAIAKDAARWLAGKTTLTEKTHFIDTRRRIRFNELSAEEKNALIRENPLYGRVICRCETVTEGEIVAAIHSPVPPTTINGVKRRVGAGMGRCQGGFCGPRVQEILSRELGIPMDKILMDQPGTYILTGETKGGAHE